MLPRIELGTANRWTTEMVIIKIVIWTSTEGTFQECSKLIMKTSFAEQIFKLPVNNTTLVSKMSKDDAMVTTSHQVELKTIYRLQTNSANDSRLH